MIDERLVELVKKYLKFSGENSVLGKDDNLKDLGLDSISSIQLLIEIEDTYDITISDDHLTDDTFSSLATLWNVIEEIRFCNA